MIQLYVKYFLFDICDGHLINWKTRNMVLTSIMGVRPPSEGENLDEPSG